MSETYCAYCCRFTLAGPFKTILHWRTGSRRLMCTPCQTVRNKPRAELVALAQREKEERKLNAKNSK